MWDIVWNNGLFLIIDNRTLKLLHERQWATCIPLRNESLFIPARVSLWFSCVTLCVCVLIILRRALNRIIARLDNNALHLHPQRSPVAKVTRACVNSFQRRSTPSWLDITIALYILFPLNANRQNDGGGNGKILWPVCPEVAPTPACSLYTVLHESLMLPQVFPCSTRASPMPYWNLVCVCGWVFCCALWICPQNFSAAPVINSFSAFYVMLCCRIKKGSYSAMMTFLQVSF